MRDQDIIHQVLVRFQEPNKIKVGSVRRLEEFTNYDGLVAVISPVDAINVDIRSYCFDYGRVREAMNKFVDNISDVLNVKCNIYWHTITNSSKNLVGRFANEPIRDASYYIVIKR